MINEMLNKSVVCTRRDFYLADHKNAVEEEQKALFEELSMSP
jgi:hypothetical protein